VSCSSNRQDLIWFGDVYRHSQRNFICVAQARFPRERTRRKTTLLLKSTARCRASSALIVSSLRTKRTLSQKPRRQNPIRSPSAASAGAGVGHSTAATIGRTRGRSSRSAARCRQNSCLFHRSGVGMPRNRQPGSRTLRKRSKISGFQAVRTGCHFDRCTIIPRQGATSRSKISTYPFRMANSFP
jgi:hypothetical protein